MWQWRVGRPALRGAASIDAHRIALHATVRLSNALQAVVVDHPRWGFWKCITGCG